MSLTRLPADLFASNNCLLMESCIIDGGRTVIRSDGTVAGIEVEAGGSIRGGRIYLSGNYMIRAMPAGGFILEETSDVKSA